MSKKKASQHFEEMGTCTLAHYKVQSEPILKIFKFSASRCATAM